MKTLKGEPCYELPRVEILSDPKTAALALKPPRPAILAALRSPDSASGLARRLELSRQRLNYYLRELEDADSCKSSKSGSDAAARNASCWPRPTRSC